MGDNLIRAARSMTRNIAEGYGRYHHRDNAKFCSNTRGSCQEVLDDLITCHDDGYISDEELAEGRKLATSAIMLTNGYIRYLRRAAKAQPPDTAKEDGPEWAFGSEADESLPDPFANNE
jgi:four helix bundle protein